MNFDEFRSAGHNLVDFIADYLQNISDKPLFNPVEPAFLYELFDEEIPDKPKSLAQIQAAMEEKVLPYCTHVNHPGYMGLITPSPNPAGILSEFLVSALNQNIGAYSIGPSATAMELRVIRWLNDLIGYDEKAGGNLTSGGMTSNFIGLKLARDYSTDDSAQFDGMRGGWVAYVSEERHVSLDKAVDAVGIGRNNLRIIPTNDKYQVRTDLLKEAFKKTSPAGCDRYALLASQEQPTWELLMTCKACMRLLSAKIVGFMRTRLMAAERCCQKSIPTCYLGWLSRIR